jgi:hypothetical protein
MNFSAEMFRSKASFVDPPSPRYGKRSISESSILLNREITTQSQWGEGEGEGAIGSFNFSLR